MSTSLIINVGPSETRVALVENGLPIEIHVDRLTDRGVVGNVYRGRVVRVLPGMQAAFVEIGLDRTAFLYVDDAMPKPVGPAEGEDDAEAPADSGEPRPNHGRRGFRAGPVGNIADVVRTGQEILVQVQKEPIGTKGARLTRHVSIPGRHLVYLPFSEHIGVSRRIEDQAERERLRGILTAANALGGGFIVRTAAEGVEGDVLAREATVLRQIWADVAKRGEQGSTPRLVFADLDLALRAARDLFDEDVERIVIDSAEDFERVRDFVRTFAPERLSAIQLHDSPQPVFDAFGIEVELERALERRVWLKSGGTIVIDEAEALTVIDVNSGRFVGKSSLEETITQINLEAVKELVYQLRLRNIGGIVIVDFIDMSAAANRDKVLTALQEALRRDKAKTTIVRMSEIGLVEMTRKRVRESLGQLLTEACPTCEGRGHVKSEATIASEILRAIVRHLAHAHAPTVLVNMQREMADYLYETQQAAIERIERRFRAQVIPIARTGFTRERYELVSTAGVGG